MRADTLRKWAGAGLLALLGVAPVAAQETSLPPLPGQPATLTPGVVDRKMPLALPDGSAMPPAVPPPATHQTEYHAAPSAACEAQERARLSGLFFDAEYLYIKPRRNSLDYAVVAPNRNELPSGTVEALEWESRSAFRFGFGYELPGHEWAVGVHYTYLHSTDSGTVNAPPGGAVYATLTRGGTFDEVATASAATSLDYNVIDVEASTHREVSETLDMKLFGGVRFAWIDQKLEATYNGGRFNANNAVVDTPVYFHGAGVTLGGEATWKIYRGFGVYGRGRGSLLSGKFRNFLTETNNGGTTSIVNVREDYYQIVPVLEMGLGVAFQTEHVRLGLGYDVANWFNMTNSLDFPGTVNVGKPGRRSSDLMLEGLSVQLGVVF